MIILRNTKQHKKDIDKIKKLYHDSFPENEQVPFWILKHNAKKEISDIFGIYDDNKFIGLLVNVYHKDIVFLWYLAILQENRNKGYGSLVLNEVSKRYKGKRLILNIEEVDVHNEEQVKRKQFYIKNGYKECGFKTEEYGVIYEMLCLKDKVTCNEYLDMMKAYSLKSLIEKNYKEIK